MKIATLEKLKFKNLQRRLRLPLWQAVGLLEALWKITCRNAPAGDIGRLTNDEIAAALEWSGDAGELIAALVETRWLDADAKHRLLVHDWAEECESWLHASFKKYGKQFATPSQSEPSQAARESIDEPPVQPTQEHHSTLSPPYPTLPYPPPPSPSSSFEPELEALPADWGVVVGELISEGVGLAESAVRSAISHRCLANEAIEVIRQWRELKPAFGAGMLKSKIENLQPGGRITWPDSPPGEKARADLERSQAKTTVSSKRAASERAKIKAENEAMETKYGPVLDAMTEHERVELTHKHGLVNAPPAMKRSQLLIAIQRDNATTKLDHVI
jgi:hypothetical protein